LLKSEAFSLHLPVRRAVLATLAVLTARAVNAQVNCETIPAGPARTDCYIGLSLINRQKSEIAAGGAQQQTNRAMYRRLTGTRPRTNRHDQGHLGK
jgi:hypothetical protein